MMDILLNKTLAVVLNAACRKAYNARRSPELLSMDTQETLEPNEIEKKKLAKILGRSVTDLFGQTETA